MRACLAANVLCLAGLITVATFAACTGSPPAQPPPAGTDAPTTAPVTETPPASTSTGDTAPPSGPKKQPETVADCKQILSEITNEPPAGAVPMNNATTAADAGASDRLAPMIDLMKAKRDGFRCCFDIWAKKNPGASGRVMLVISLDPDGKLKKAFVKQDASGIHAPEVESCMVDLAKSMTFPKSPSGKETEFSYPFDFKAKN
jgi:hypothetical protein